jgi:outer membrane protein assembly factor BamD (BamD/ComL family)
MNREAQHGRSTTRQRMARASIVLALAASGCVGLREERDALARYERTREELRRAQRGELDRPSPEDLAGRQQPITVSDFAPENVKSTFARLAGQGPAPEDADRLYKEAQALYAEAVQLRDQGQPEAATRFGEAAERFAAAAKKFPRSMTEQNGLYFSGEAYFFADHFVKANEQWEKLLKEYPNSIHLDDVQRRRFAIAKYWLEDYRYEQPKFYELNLTDDTKPWNGWFTNAMRVYDRIRLDDPTGKLADDATLALATAHFADGSYAKADEYFTDLRKSFPSSEHQFTAHFLGLKAKLLTYQGADYGGTVLDESEKLVHTMRKQFPLDAEREREFLARALAEVRYRKAEREFQIAEYHDARAEYGAARYYYAIVLNEYGDTRFAQFSRERVAAIAGYPDVPPQRFEWLVDAFPREEEVRPLIATDKPKSKKR